MRTEQEKNLLLASVSRSFYLTIRALPKTLRHPIRTAYLLARISDTIADTPGIPIPDRRAHLALLRQAVAGEISFEETLRIALEATPQQTNHSEKILLTHLLEVLEDYQALQPEDLVDVHWVLEQIMTGQEEDIALQKLTTDSALERYTWLVAGCVGEFWTRLCSRKIRRFSQLSLEEMLTLGSDYGKGLQLVNILRDYPEDVAQGRYYLPDPTQYASWLERASVLLENGWCYVLALRSWRLRFACALPALIGFRTLLLLGKTPPEKRLKVSRPEVRKILFKAAWRSCSSRWLAGCRR